MFSSLVGIHLGQEACMKGIFPHAVMHQSIIAIAARIQHSFPICPLLYCTGTQHVCTHLVYLCSATFITLRKMWRDQQLVNQQWMTNVHVLHVYKCTEIHCTCVWNAGKDAFPSFDSSNSMYHWIGKLLILPAICINSDCVYARCMSSLYHQLITGSSSTMYKFVQYAQIPAVFLTAAHTAHTVTLPAATLLAARVRYACNSLVLPVKSMYKLT